MRRHMSKVGLILVVVGLCCGVWLSYDGTRTSAPPQPAAADALRGSASPAPSVTPSGPAALPDSPPTRIRIPEIRVNAPITETSLDSAHHLQVPPLSHPNLAGWYRGSASPGSIGNAVVLGHVDTRRGPAVFYNLGALHKGDTIHIDRRDHRTAVFSIDAIQVFAKDAFPSKTVYGDTARPELRVITCGGGFSKSADEYLGNVVVFAHFIGAAPDGH